ncbi:MAG TPA: helix-turn-helix transcriptional regulator [Chloroflexota bacterium]
MVEVERLNSESDVLHAWGHVIRRYRQWKQLSRRGLAERAGVSPVFLGEIERGEKDPSSHTLCLLADALDVSLSELLVRVATRLQTDRTIFSNGREQTSIPAGVREQAGEYLEAVPTARDETAFDLYKVARRLQPEQQASLLLLAHSINRRVG